MYALKWQALPAQDWEHTRMTKRLPARCAASFSQADLSLVCAAGSSRTAAHKADSPAWPLAHEHAWARARTSMTWMSPWSHSGSCSGSAQNGPPMRYEEPVSAHCCGTGGPCPGTYFALSPFITCAPQAHSHSLI